MTLTVPAMIAAVALLGADGLPRSLAQSPRFVRIYGPPENPDALGAVSAISPDGVWVGGDMIPPGTDDQVAFRWSEATGVQFLGWLPNAQYRFSVPDGMSLNAEVIVGQARNHCGDVAFMWRDGRMWELPLPPGAWPCLSSASDVTPDGRVAVGSGLVPGDPNSAAAWIEGGFKRLASDDPAIAFAMAIGLTPDAAVVVGSGRPLATPTVAEAVRFEDGRLVRLGRLPTWRASTYAYAASDSGRVIAASATASAFLWSEPTSIVELPLPIGAITFGGAYALSHDGRVAAGVALLPGRGGQAAAVWTAHTGTRYLADILTEAGVDLQGYTRILNADHMSADGLKFACRAHRPPETVTRPFYAVIPPFCFADCDNSGAVDFADLLCFLTRFERAAADPRANPIDFFYCDFAADDEIDFNDFLAYLNLYNKGCGE